MQCGVVGCDRSNCHKKIVMSQFGDSRNMLEGDAPNGMPRQNALQMEALPSYGFEYKVSSKPPVR